MSLHDLQHHLNALHVWVRLTRIGLPRPTALTIARWWEQMIHPFLYPAMRPLIPVRVPAPVRLSLRSRHRDD